MITERITKQQFFKKGLHTELSNLLKENFYEQEPRLTIKWYDGFDINEIRSRSTYLWTKTHHPTEYINELIDSFLNPISESDVLVLIQLTYFAKDNLFERYVSRECKIVDYTIPTDGWLFNVEKQKWILKSGAVTKIADEQITDKIKSLFVNQLGINTYSIDDVIIDRQDDGQLKEIKIEFHQAKE